MKLSSMLSRWPAACVALALFPRLPAQESGRSESTPGMVQAFRVDPQPIELDVPMPPRAILRGPPPHSLAPVPAGAANAIPQPGSAATTPREAAAGVVTSPGDFTLFMNRPVTPAGASTNTIGEPSAAIHRDVGFYTGNAYAAVSGDSGMTWTHVNPFTRFPASDGGFCCDQRTVHIPSHDLTVWLLQYSQGGVNNTNRYRIAVARGRDALKAGTWVYADWTPAMLGHPEVGAWLDFPDLAFGQDHLYVSANVFNLTSNRSIDAVVWRVDLADLAGTMNWSYNYARQSSSLGSGASYRFTQGAWANMFFASHLSSSELRIFVWPESSGTITYYDRSIAGWSSNAPVSITPDGFNWTARSDNRILGGYATETEVGWMWNCGQSGASRPQPYTRVARFLRSGVTHIGDHDIWNSTRAIQYPCVTTNARGHMGGSIAIGGGDLYPSLLAFMVDGDSSAWAPLDAAFVRTGNRGPARQVWGDYFTVQRHPVKPETWVASGMTLQGGTGDSSSEPRWVWFGRDRDNPGTVPLSVTSTPVSNVPIDVAMMDRQGQQDGSTPFTRSYSVNQGYRLTAPPNMVTFGNGTYAFERWTLAGLPRPVDERVLEVSSIGSSGETAVAVYQPRHTLTIQSTNPAMGTHINVSPDDLSGNGNGTTSFTRIYRETTRVTLTAPLTTLSGSRFQFWSGILFHDTNPTITVTVGGDRTFTAVYYRHTVGSFTPFGSGCAGPSGVTTQHVNGTPEIGNTLLYQVWNGPRGSTGFMAMGFDNTAWGAIPLPLPLHGAGAPGCTLYAPGEVLFACATNATQGYGQVSLTVPDDRSLIGGRFFTQFWNLDAAANALHLTFTDGLNTLVGGYQP